MNVVGATCFQFCWSSSIKLTLFAITKNSKITIKLIIHKVRSLKFEIEIAIGGPYMRFWNIPLPGPRPASTVPGQIAHPQQSHVDYQKGKCLHHSQHQIQWKVQKRRHDRERLPGKPRHTSSLQNYESYRLLTVHHACLPSIQLAFQLSSPHQFPLNISWGLRLFQLDIPVFVRVVSPAHAYGRQRPRGRAQSHFEKWHDEKDLMWRRWKDSIKTNSFWM